jgi:regulator of sigma E protease
MMDLFLNRFLAFLERIPTLGYSFFAFALLFLPLVVFHELGHFWMAKLCGVRADVFSICFGRPLWKRRFGETEFRIGWIPLGGYVQLLGSDPEIELSEEEKKRALPFQTPWKRFLVYVGGPLFNWILAAVLFMILMMHGEPRVAAVVGQVLPSSPASHAGLQSGDKILSMDGVEVHLWDEWMGEVRAYRPGDQVRLQVQRDGQVVPLLVLVTGQEGYNAYGEWTTLGDIEGVIPQPRSTQVGVSNPHSKAGKAGITFGELKTFQEKDIPNFEVFEQRFAALPVGEPGRVKILQGGEDHWIYFEKNQPQESVQKVLGLWPREVFVDGVVPDSPAAALGLQVGDRIVSVGHHLVQSFFGLKFWIQSLASQHPTFELVWERGGRFYSSPVHPNMHVTEDALLKKGQTYTIGVSPKLEWKEPEMVIRQVWNPLILLKESVTRVAKLSWAQLVSLVKTLVGTVSSKQLGGPLMIGKVASESLERGWILFVTNMALFSIGLGLFNILPFPPLDGGHILLLGLETLWRKPLSLRFLQVIHLGGLVFLLGLMLIAFRNDFLRLFASY